MQRTTKLIVFSIAIMHIMMGVAIIGEPAAIRVSSLHILEDLLGGRSYIAGSLLITVGMIATYAPIPKKLLWAYMLTIPQQAMLSMQVWSVLEPMMTGVYPDLYSPAGGGTFIFVDQLPVLTLALAPVVDAVVTAFSRGTSQ